MSEAHLLYNVENHVASIKINRELQRNAISPEAITLFLEALDDAEKDDDVRVVMITGAGNKAFCSGADLSSVMGGDPKEAGVVFKQYASLIKRIAKFPKPTVARVNGTCIAGGTGFMLACDIVVASSKARFGTPEVGVGLFPMMIGALIFKNVLRKDAMEMMLLGELFTAERAKEIGMVTRVVDPEKLDEEMTTVLTGLAEKSPIGISIGKKAFNAIESMDLEDSVNYLAEQLQEVMKTEDAKEGITAFIEKRKPSFKGR